MAERRYNEKELAEILRAAAKSQAEGSSNPEESSGYSLAEIERLATEVGIDPAHVLAAADGLQMSSTEDPRFRFWGMPVRQTFERTIDGPMSDATWEEIVAYLRDKFGYNGTASQVGSSQEWSGSSDFRAVHLSLTPKDGKIRIRIAMRFDEILFLSWIVGFALTFLTSVVTTGLMSKAGIGGLIIPAVLAIFTMIWFLVHQSLVKRNAKEVSVANDLMSTMTKMIENANNEPTLSDRLSTAQEPAIESKTVKHKAK